MMDDLVERARALLISNKIDLSTTGEKEIIAKSTIGDAEVEVRCKLTDSFPYELPKIYVTEESKAKLGKTLHLFEENQLCVFDKAKVIPNFRNPEGLIADTIIAAFSMLSRAGNGHLEEDFADEFKAYWDCHAKLDLFSDVEFGDVFLQLKFAIGNSKSFIATTEENLRNLFEKTYQGNEFSAENCIYIPLDSYPAYGQDKTHLDWMKIVKNRSKYYDKYSKFLASRNASKSLVLFSRSISGKRVVCAFTHNKLIQVNGFRKGKIPLPVALAGAPGRERIEHVEINDITQNRLFSRGGDGKTCSKKAIGLVGCGSLGSSIADSLAKSGYSKFSFYDNEVLTADNIARHRCGFCYAGIYKVNALKRALEEHNPNIECNCCKENIHTKLNEESPFDNLDIVISTVADAPIEYRLQETQIKGKFNGTLIIAWVEPYAMAGHAIIMNKPQDIYSELFSKELVFIGSVVDDSSKYFKRESGCQSTYMPYSGLDIAMFSGVLVKNIEKLTKDPKKNYHLLWLGNISIADTYGVSIDEKYKAYQDYSIHIERID